MEFLSSSCRHRVSHSETSKVLAGAVSFATKTEPESREGLSPWTAEKRSCAVPQNTSRPLRKPRSRVSRAPRAPGVLPSSQAIIAAPSSCTHLTCGLPSEPKDAARVASMTGTLSGMHRQPEAAKQEHAEDRSNRVTAQVGQAMTGPPRGRNSTQKLLQGFLAVLQTSSPAHPERNVAVKDVLPERTRSALDC